MRWEKAGGSFLNAVRNEGKKVLFISGSIGLGHIWRDITIAHQLRALDKDVSISWLADDPATVVLRNTGETLLPEAEDISHGNDVIDRLSSNYRANNLAKWSATCKNEVPRNAEVFSKVMERERFDLVIGDETYDLGMSLAKRSHRKSAPYMELYDFIGLDAMRPRLSDIYGAFRFNLRWYRYLTARPNFVDRSIFLGMPEDIPDRRFGIALPSRRSVAERHLSFAGYVLPFHTADLSDRKKVREQLNYGDEPLIICSIGGTTVGGPLLELCGRAFPIVRTELPDLRMVLVCGPRLDTASVRVPEGVEVRGYIPELYNHFAAADLSIVTGGGSSTLELIALQRPFIYFPLEEHSEQEHSVAKRCERLGAGKRMGFSHTTPEMLADAIIENIGRKVNYPQLPTDGAVTTAKIAAGLIEER